MRFSKRSGKVFEIYIFGKLVKEITNYKCGFNFVATPPLRGYLAYAPALAKNMHNSIFS